MRTLFFIAAALLQFSFADAQELRGRDSRATRGFASNNLAEESNWNEAKKLTIMKSLPDLPPPGRDTAMDIDNVNPGDRGRIRYWNFKVGDIVDDYNMILNLGSSRQIWVEGYPTNGLVDNQSVRIVDYVEFVKTVSYETVAGSKVTIWKVRPVDKDENEKLMAKDIEESKFRNWKLPKGKSFKGKFVKLSGSVANFVEQDGKKVRVQLRLLTPHDQEEIKKLHAEYKEQLKKLRESKKS